jgi:hypothetical protein
MGKGGTWKMETCFNYCDPKKAFFSSDERKWITKIRKLYEEHPDEMRMIAEPETNDGCIYVELPASWLKIQPKRKIEMTEEEKEALRERFEKVRHLSSQSR